MISGQRGPGSRPCQGCGRKARGSVIAAAPSVDEARAPRLRERADRVDAAERVADLGGEALAAVGDVGTGIDELPVLREADRGREEHLRDRLTGVDALLELILLRRCQAAR